MLTTFKYFVKYTISLMAFIAVTSKTDLSAQDVQNALSINLTRVYSGIELNYEQKFNDQISMLFNATIPFFKSSNSGLFQSYKDIGIGSRAYFAPNSYGTFFSVNAGLQSAFTSFPEKNKGNQLFGEALFGYQSDGESFFYEYGLGIKAISSHNTETYLEPRLKLNIGFKF